MNNSLQNLSTATKTMSSNEIAQLTGKQKKHVHQDIKDQLFIGLYGLKDGQDFDHVEIQGITVILDNRGYWSEVLLDHEHTLTLMTGYDVKARHIINKRWLELESAQQFTIPTTLSEALLLAGQLAAEKEAALAKIKQDEPKVAFAEAVRRLDGCCSIGDFAKAVGTGQNRLFKRLRDDGFLMVNNRPYQSHIDRGLFEVIEMTPYTDRDGNSHPAFKTVITGKGQVFLEKRYRIAVDGLGVVEYS